MEFEYKILTDYRLILLHYRGKASLDDLFNTIRVVAKDKDFNPNFSILNDLRDCTLMTDKKSIQKLTDFVKNNSGVYSERKTAMLTDTPGQVVFSTLLVDLKNESRVSIKIVSTLESAIMFLTGETEKINYLSGIIEQLRIEGK